MSFRPMFSALQEIADAVLGTFQDPRLVAEFQKDGETSHGFWKRTLPKKLWEAAAEKTGLGGCEIQVEIVDVTTELGSETHGQRENGTLIVILEARAGHDISSEPHVYKDGVWTKVAAGDVIEIPPEKVHSFTVGHLGLLRFLSVQYPPVTRLDTTDDPVCAPP